MKQWFQTRGMALAVIIAGLGVAAACEQAKSSSPLSPSIAGPLAGVTIEAPPPVQPVSNQKIKDSEQPITIKFNNGDSTGVRPLTHAVQVSSDIAFTVLVYSQAGIAPSPNGQVSVTLPAKLQFGRSYYWRARAEDGANKSEWSEPIRFEVLQPIVIGVPIPVSPVGNVRITGTSVPLVVNNGLSSGPHEPLRYHYQASRDAAFTQLVANDVVPQGSGQTSYTVISPANDVVVYWRVRITDGPNTGAWSGTETYRTAAPVVVTPVNPTNPGGPCIASSPEQIVICERRKYGQMSDGQMLELMKQIARSLNSNGISGGPYGILRKTGGHNCGGYSCDVICAGNGGNQRQWDVLGDIQGAQSPMWSGPIATIRVDICSVP